MQGWPRAHHLPSGLYLLLETSIAIIYKELLLQFYMLKCTSIRTLKHFGLNFKTKFGPKQILGVLQNFKTCGQFGNLNGLKLFLLK